MKLHHLVLAALSALMLAACSDSPQEMEPVAVDNTVPASAQATTGAWLTYSAALPSTESAEPVDVNNATPPVSDTEEPRAI